LLLVAQRLHADAEKVDRAISHLLEAAADGDLKSAQALLPWLDQALGKPTERREITQPQTLQALDEMTTEELAAMVSEGRKRRLRAVSGE